MRLNLPFADRLGFGPDSLETARQLSLALLESRGEAQGTRTAERLTAALASLGSEARKQYDLWLVESLGPDEQALASHAAEWLDRRDAANALKLARSAEPRRQELLRRLNSAPGGTRHLVDWRARLLADSETFPALAPLEADLKHLLGSWFNRGFLALERITWGSPARLLETLIAHEAVHSIAGWDDLRGRVEGDRRCYGFFHPAMPGAPLIFVEVALTDRISDAIAPLLDHPPNRTPLDRPSTAIFYSISNCEPGLRGLNFGNFLIKQIAADLKAEIPGLTTFATLSPIPGFRRWLDAGGRDLGTGDDDDLERLCALYLTGVTPEGAPGRPSDPVAVFHLGNGAELWRINAHADSSTKGQAQSEGLMVNYLYREDMVAANHKRFAASGTVARSRQIARLIEGRRPSRLSWPLSRARMKITPPAQETPTCR